LAPDPAAQEQKNLNVSHSQAHQIIKTLKLLDFDVVNNKKIQK